MGMGFSPATNLDPDTLTQIWAEFVYEDKMDPRVQPAVADGWRQCKAAGMDPGEGGYGTPVDEAIFQSILEENRVLLDIANPIMQSVYEVMRQSHFSLVLTDSVGYILECIGSEDALNANRACNFIKGTLWNNLSVGTNAISAALDHDVAIQIVGAEHYCRSHHNSICSAAPIHSPEGDVIGCLNLSGAGTQSHPHSLGLVLAAAQGIEGKLALRRTAEIMRAALESGEESIVLLGRDCRPVWANSAARRLLQTAGDELLELDFRQIIPNLDWSDQFWRQGERQFFNDVRIVTKEGTWRCSAAVSPLMDLGVPVLSVALKPQKHLIAAVNKLSGNCAVYTFADIFTQDLGMKRVLAQAQKYARYDGNIFIEGESGTGKELLAQAIHNASRRAKGPFVSVDCSAIPRDFWELSLFGYESDVFPGASCEGNPGRFELANHGTLFLDEVGEIPLDVQAKLLRAVETHCITRIGGKEEIQLDIRIIVSTNHNLDSDVANHSFSPELFYRFNILRLRIPPLRERSGDIAYCAGRFLERLNTLYPNTPHSASPAFLAGLERYEWPGNTRELQNAVERTFLSSPQMVLGEESLRLAFSPAPEKSRPAPQSPQDGEEAECIRTTLAACGGDVDGTAEKLGVSRATLYRRMKRYGISPKRLRHHPNPGDGARTGAPGPDREKTGQPNRGN